jgi:hypothetical protein
VVTSGNSSRTSYRGGRWPAAVLTLVCLLMSGCGSGSPSAVSGSETRQTKPVDSKQTWCKANPNAAWESILAGRVVALSRRASLSPLALANDGRLFFAEIYSKAYSGVIEVDARSSRYIRIKRFTDPVNYQASGNFDGRWLVWAEYHSLYDELSDFTIWSWDSRSGRLRQIGAATRSPSGKFWPSTWQAPVAHEGYAAWQQGAGPDELGDIHVVDLATDRDRIVRRGHPGAPFLIDGPRVVWSESMKRGVSTVMRIADAKTGRVVATPPALRKLRGAIWPASNGKALVYATDGQMSLWRSPSLSVAPKLVFASRSYQLLKIPFDETWGRYTTFSVPFKTFVVDTVAGRYVRIYRGGWAITGPKALVLLKPSKQKANHAINDVVFIPLKSLPPVPPCS